MVELFKECTLRDHVDYRVDYSPRSIICPALESPADVQKVGTLGQGSSAPSWPSSNSRLTHGHVTPGLYE